MTSLDMSSDQIMVKSMCLGEQFDKSQTNDVNLNLILQSSCMLGGK